MDKSDKSVIAYIDRQYDRLINTIKYQQQYAQYPQNRNTEDKVHSIQYTNIQSYLAHYEDIDIVNLREIFAYFHENINRLVEEYPKFDSNYNESDYDYHQSQIDDLFSKIKSFKHNLKNSKYAFKMKDSYERYIVTTDNIDYSDLEILEVEPIFELVEGLESFQELILKLYDKNWDLGETFQSKVRYKSLKNNLLIWETMLSEEEKALLTENWKDIKEYVHEIFGLEVKIKNILVKDIDIKKNRSINQANNIMEKKIINRIE